MTIHQTVYYPFSEIVIDFEDFEKQIIENDVKLFLLCTHHNPVGQVLKQEELKLMGEICLQALD